MRRSRAWRGLSMLIMEPKKSSISSGMSSIDVAPWPDRKISGCRLASLTWACLVSRVVAVPLLDGQAELRGDLRVVEVGHRALAAQRAERTLRSSQGRPQNPISLRLISSTSNTSRGCMRHTLSTASRLEVRAVPTLRPCAIRCAPPAPEGWCSPRTRTGRRGSPGGLALRPAGLERLPTPHPVPHHR